jgi:glycosyltransferase involved in cell wall biosynthesis
VDQRPLSILHTNFHLGWGGQPSRILMQSLGMARRGHRVVIGAPEGSILAERARDLGLETFEKCKFPKMKRFPLVCRDAYTLDAYLRTREFDLIDAHGSQDLWVATFARGAGRWGFPLVFTRHNTKRLKDHFPNRLIYRRMIDHLIVASASILERYQPYLERGDITPDRVSVVHSSYWEDRFHPGVDGSGVRREIAGDHPSALLVGLVGRLVTDKGGIHFLRAAARLAGEFPDARFVFAGTGSEEANLRAAAAEMGIDPRVHFLGFRNDVPQVISALDLLVLPSVDCDASSAALKEAMAIGRPVVATTVGGASEIVRDGETGLLVAPGDDEALAAAIARVLRLPDHGRSTGEQGCRAVKAFSQERLVEGTLAAYTKALGRESRRRRAKAVSQSGTR